MSCSFQIIIVSICFVFSTYGNLNFIDDFGTKYSQELDTVLDELTSDLSSINQIQDSAKDDNEISSLTTACTASESCMSTTIVDNNIYCYGYFACRQSTIWTLSSLNCFGSMSCYQATMYTYSSTNAFIKCDGQNSCGKSTLTSTIEGNMFLSGSYSGYASIISASYSNVYCRGFASCRWGTITSNITYCTGHLSCLYEDIIAYSELISSGYYGLYSASIKNTPYIYDIGSYTFRYAEISSLGLDNLEIISRGDYSTSETIVLCYSGSSCVIRCQGDASCDGLTLYCEDGANCQTFRDGRARCPHVNYTSSIDDDVFITKLKNKREIELLESKATSDFENKIKTMQLLVNSETDYNAYRFFQKIIDGKYGVYFIIVMCATATVIVTIAVMALIYQCITYLLKTTTNSIDTSNNNDNNPNRYQYQSI